MSNTQIRWCWIPIVVAAISATPGGAATFTVGPVGSPGCTHSSLTDALAAAASSPGSDEIRLLDGSTHSGFFLVTGPLFVVGGYASCTASAPVGSSTLSGPGGSRVVSAIANGSAINFARLVITGGAVNGDGGRIRLSGSEPGVLVLEQVSVVGNSATGRGGGIFVDSSGGVGLVLDNSGVVGNLAVDGGGIVCNAPAAFGLSTVLLGGNFTIEANVASGNGGGLWFGEGCRGVSWAVDGFAQTIYGNMAAGLGGGVFIRKGRFEALGEGAAMARIEENSAASGGGVYANDLGLLLAEHLDIVRNHADNFGGGVMLGHNGLASITPFGVGPSTCSGPGRCLRLRQNDATTGAAMSVVGGFAVIEAADVSGNVATSTGSAVAEVRTGGRLGVLNSVVRNNIGADLLAVDNTNSELELTFSTLANNLVTAGLIGVGVNAAALHIDGNMVVNHSGPLFSRYDRPAPPTLRCTMSTTAALFTSLPPGTVQEVSLVQPDPKFKSAASNDFHLVRTSPAIDACPAASTPTSTSVDFDGEDRDFDNPWNGVGGAVGDIGADEYAPLFVDGFETGDTSSWSGASP